MTTVITSGTDTATWARESGPPPPTGTWLASSERRHPPRIGSIITGKTWAQVCRQQPLTTHGQPTWEGENSRSRFRRWRGRILTSPHALLGPRHSWMQETNAKLIWVVFLSLVAKNILTQTLRTKSQPVSRLNQNSHFCYPQHFWHQMCRLYRPKKADSNYLASAQTPQIKGWVP